MRYIILISTIVALAFNVFPQVDQQEVTVINIVVPFRAFDGNRFIDNLTISDLVLYEDGIPQNIQSLYLARGNNIERAEGVVTQKPVVSRNFYLLFQLTEYNPQISEALTYFFNDMFFEKDTVTLMTPYNTYTLSKAAVRAKTKDVLIRDTIARISGDTQIGAADYNSQLNDLKRLVSALASAARGGEQGITSGLESDQTLLTAGGISMLLPRTMETLNRMEELRVVDEGRIIKFASQLKRQPGRKYVFFFYQREYRPEIHPNTLNRLMMAYQSDTNIQGQLQDLFSFYRRDISLDTERLKQAFADSDILFNFLFMNRQPENVSGIYMREQSEDVFRIFSEVANATGGVVDSSQNPASAFSNAAKISDTYYLLYYSPKEYKSDGRFHNIVVMVKGKNYRITHRQGYIAN
ncbi:VWA domain-containing protein [bacterium]|nr:VWA domain-containing protein [bacterium]